ncbi:sugar ABC transporter substrate-binding protein [Streptosporangium sp. NPDC051022]|uniref:sugar ABC transporter substrate-binding protein n=1 Tax=Streptosporangium sp. NPDC051022 TaxID=3155752 RepID=UPI003430E41F
MMKPRTPAMRLIALSAAALLLAGCAQKTDSTQADSTQGTAQRPADLTYASAQVERYSATPAFEPPGESFDAKKIMNQKLIYSVPVNGALDFTQMYKGAMERLASQVGFEFKTWQNGGKPTEWGQGIQAAVTAGADVIDLFAGIDPTQVVPQIAQAREKKIPIVASDTYDASQPPASSVDLAVNCPCADAARLMADWVAVKTKGDADVLVLTSSDVKASEAGEKAFKEEFARVCPDCRVTYIDIPSADWAGKIQPQVQSALVANPGLDYVLPIYDTMSIWASQAIKQAGRAGKVKIVTYNGTPSILKMMQEDDVIEMNVGQSNDWMAHVVLDQMMRRAGGLPANPKATWPLYVWTKANVAQAGSPPTDSQGYGDAYRQGFTKLWGLS